MFKFLSFVIVLAISYYIYAVLESRNAFVVVNPINHEDCFVTLRETVGNEDIVFLHNSKVAILAGDERGWLHPGFFSSEKRSQVDLIATYPKQGSLNFFDMKNLSSDTIIPGKLVGYKYDDFHPHGLGLYEQEGKKPLLFVVNHNRHGDCVDVFEVHEEDHSFHFKYRVQEGFLNWNDVEAINENSFFVSRMIYYGNDNYRSIFEIVYNPQWSSLVYCEKFVDQDEHICEVVLDSLSGTNGVNYSKDRKYLLVAHMFPHKVDVFSIEWKTVQHPRERKVPKLKFEYDIPVDMLVDNLFVDDNGDVYATGHMNPLKVLVHLQDRVSDSPSKVVKITGDFSNPSSIRAEDVLVVDGKLFSGLSVSIHYKGKLVTGSIHEKGVMVCPIQLDNDSEK